MGAGGRTEGASVGRKLRRRGLVREGETGDPNREEAELMWHVVRTAARWTVGHCTPGAVLIARIRTVVGVVAVGVATGVAMGGAGGVRGGGIQGCRRSEAGTAAGLDRLRRADLHQGCPTSRGRGLRRGSWCLWGQMPRPRPSRRRPGTRSLLRSRRPAAPPHAVSNSSNCLFRSRPPAYPVREPSAPTTRWQGRTTRTGLRPRAVPRARTAARDRPRRSASFP